MEAPANAEHEREDHRGELIDARNNVAVEGECTAEKARFARSRLAVHYYVFWVFVAERKAGPNTCQDIDKDNCDGIQRVWEAEEDVEEVRKHFWQCCTEAVGNALL